MTTEVGQSNKSPHLRKLALVLKLIAEGNNNLKLLLKNVNKTLVENQESKKGVAKKTIERILDQLEQEELVKVERKSLIKRNNTLPGTFSLIRPDLYNPKYVSIVLLIFKYASKKEVREFMLTEFFFNASVELSEFYDLLLPDRIIIPKTFSELEIERIVDETRKSYDLDTKIEEIRALIRKEADYLLGPNSKISDERERENTRFLIKETENILIDAVKWTNENTNEIMFTMDRTEHIESLKNNLEFISKMNEQIKLGNFKHVLLKLLLISPSVAQFMYASHHNLFKTLVPMVLRFDETPKSMDELYKKFKELSSSDANNEFGFDTVRYTFFEATGLFDPTDVVMPKDFLFDVLDSMDESIKIEVEKYKMEKQKANNYK